VKVISGPAPVKVGKKTLMTVDTGTELTVLKVQGNWVKVIADKDGKEVTGWIHRKRLKLLTHAPKPEVRAPAAPSKLVEVRQQPSGGKRTAGARA